MQRTVIERRLVEPGNPAAGEVILSGIQREDSVAWTEIRLTFENGASQELPVPEDAHEKCMEAVLRDVERRTVHSGPQKRRACGLAA